MKKIIDLNKYKKSFNREKLSHVRDVKENVLTDPIIENNNINDVFGFSNVYEENNQYLYRSSSGIKVISNFVIKPVELIEGENIAEFKVQFHTTNNKVFTKILRTSDFSSVSRFKSILNQNCFGLIFKGNNDNLEDIKNIIANKTYKVIKGVKYIGFIKNGNEYIFVSENGCIDKYGNKINNITLLEQYKMIDTNLCDIDSISKEELQKISKHLFNFNDISITSTILGFCSSCFLKQKLWDAQEIKLNHLLITGEAGSGKTDTIRHIVMKIFGTTTSTSADQCTRFVNAKMSTSSNTIPFIIEEYKTSKLKNNQINEISALLRSSWDTTSAFRGTAKQELVEYKPLSPIILVGEMGTDETAIVERSLSLLFSKSKIKDVEKQRSFRFLKRNSQILNKLGRSLLEQALNIDSYTLLQRKEYWEQKISHEVPDRVKNSISNCMLGIELLKDVFTLLQLDFNCATGYSIEELFNAIYNNVLEVVLEGGNSTKGVIDKSIELFNDMAELGKLKHGIDYQIINNGSELALHIKNFYGKFLKHIKDQNLKDFDLLSSREFTKQLRLKEYFVDYKTVRFIRGDKVNIAKAYILDIEKLKERVDISNFI
ncbi:hypothetical protein [Caloranaerobacter ferrireducens]|uniref:hypothetical protein n=1 Tax=Caloranaerobacter ferrireducens TaxID=1323370 RepID=UPI00084DDDFA|nr:hypothetical protein [Caloranaerobacter ferrireducens]